MDAAPAHVKEEETKCKSRDKIKIYRTCPPLPLARASRVTSVRHSANFPKLLF